jgi:hypothetical protein
MPKDASTGKAPKTCLDKVVAVIVAQNTPGGSSRQAIAKGYKEKWGEVASHAFKAALKKGCDSSVLVQAEGGGQRWWVAGHEPPPPAEDEAVGIVDVKVGSGEAAVSGSTCTMSYKGTLKDGTQFDAAGKFSFTIDAGEVIKGWDQGVKGMCVGGRRKLVVPSKLGYGKRGSPPDIPGDSTLLFDVTLKAVQ